MSDDAGPGSDFIVLLARARSGTHPLRSVLGSHPEIFSTPEIFHNDPEIEDDVELAHRVNFFQFLERDPPAYVGRSSSSARQAEVFLAYLSYLRELSPKRFVLVDVKYNSTHHFEGPWRTVSAPPAFFHLTRSHRLRVLHLTRKNYLRYYLSLTQAQREQAWFTEAPATDAPMEVDIPGLLSAMWDCQAESEAVEGALAGYDHCLSVEYDDVFLPDDAGPSGEFLGQMADWLSVDPQGFEQQPRYRKQSRLGLSERITNYAAVEDALRGTPFEYCLEDERIYRAPGG